MITEIATLQLRDEDDLSSPSSTASKVIREITAPNLLAHKARFVYYGQFIEKPNTLVIFVNWNTIDDHKSFASSP